MNLEGFQQGPVEITDQPRKQGTGASGPEIPADPLPGHELTHDLAWPPPRRAVLSVSPAGSPGVGSTVLSQLQPLPISVMCSDISGHHIRKISQGRAEALQFPSVFSGHLSPAQCSGCARGWLLPNSF